MSIQKLKEKKLISDEGTLDIMTKITREQLGNNVRIFLLLLLILFI